MFFAIERIRRLTAELQKYRVSQKIEITRIGRKPCDYGAYELVEAGDAAFAPYEPGTDWGGRDSHTWFRFSFTVPENFAGKTLVLQVETGRTGWDALNPQFLVFVNGAVRQGLDVNHKEVVLTQSAAAGESFRFDLFGYSGMNEGYAELKAAVAVFEPAVENLAYHLLVPLQTAELLDAEDIRRVGILNALTEAVNRLDLRRPFDEAFFKTVGEAAALLERELYGKNRGLDGVTEVCVGHTHIDVAWLWTLSQTREKSVRSFATVIELMKRYPEYIFMSSQPQLYEYVKEDQPGLYEEIKAMVRAGRWEPEGAMWLEADCNLTSGESLVRQVLYGKRFFQQEFGVDSKILWLPDVFGYSAALPQILKKSGVDYFMTTKISWNEFNKLPYDTFEWKGIDGTKVLTYFVSTQDYNLQKKATGTTYNGNTNPRQALGCWDRYQQKELNGEVLNSFGFGDGGGGPTAEMLEMKRRLDEGVPGMPLTRSGRALDFFQDLEKRVAGSSRLPEWVGELYLEYHRGTYTTNARNKRFNRKTEFLNQDAELYATLDAALCGGEYPQEALHDCWKTTLLNQFHDIIPGSSIREVYDDSKAQYERINAVAAGIVHRSLKAVAARIAAPETSAAVFNPLGFDRDDVVAVDLPAGWAAAQVLDGGAVLPSQPAGGGKWLFFAKGVPAKGYKLFTLRRAEQAGPFAPTAAPDHLENRFFDLRFGPDGSITSLADKRAGRQVLKDGARGNVLQAFEDKPFEYDAWNLDIYYQEKMWELDGPAELTVIEEGPVRTGLRIRKTFLDSTVTQTVYVYADLPRVDFDTMIDWKEKQIVLKAAFPVDIHADKAAYEIQFGNVERPTHWNTSWDWARFEVCAHKWADLSEEGYGVSLLNDCKYGHDIRDSVMRLTLLKSPVEPNTESDRELHRFVYSLYPHAEGWREAGTAAQAYSLNCPLAAVPLPAQPGTLPGSFSLVRCGARNVCIETVKRAEEGGDTVVRLYEFENRRTPVTLRFGLPVKAVCECDLLENDTQPLETAADGVKLTLQPYEIRTLKVRF